MVEKFGKWPGVVAIVGDAEMYCGGGCGTPLCDNDCLCYHPGQDEHWCQYGTFFDEDESEVE
jgi:hypothetical protein